MKLICRTCLRMQSKYFNIFTHLENDKLISDMLMEHTTIKVYKNDGLPVNMCATCLKKLHSVLDFKAMVIRSDAQLHNFFRNVSIHKNKKNNKNLQNHNSTTFSPEIVKEELPLEDKGYGSSVCSLDESKLSNLQDKSEQEEKLTALSVNEDNSFESDCINFEQNMLPQNDKNKVTELLSDHEECDLATNTDEHHKSESSKDSDHSISKEETEISPKDDYNYIQCSSVINEIKENEISQNNFDNVFSHCNNIQTEDNLINKITKESIGFENEDINIMEFNTKKTDRRRYFCKECNKFFGYRYYFGIHVRQHTGDKPHKCDVCDKSFAKPFLLKLHKRIHSNEKPYSCHTCGKTFRYLSSLPDHMLTHTEIRSYKCNICNKAFKVRKTLRMHLLIHKGEKSFVCELCGKSFHDKCGLVHHWKSHKTEKAFPCSACDKSFTNKSYLNTHYRRRHTNERPYVCSYCNKPFRCNATLRNHILIHTGAKPHSCKVCGRAFTQASCVTRHMRIHTGETPYECKQCPCSFKYSHHLLNHMKKHK